MKRAFTLVELLVVMGIIAVLAGIGIPVAGIVRTKAREAKCANQLKQLYTGIQAFRLDHNQEFPYALIKLFDPGNPLEGQGNPADGYQITLWRCPVDPARGTNRKLGRKVGGSWGDLEFAYEPGCSYLFEASDAPIDQPPINDPVYPWRFANGEPWYLPPARTTWWEAKAYQLRHGNTGGTPFKESELPIIRCFHHHDWTNDLNADNVKKVHNVAWDGTIFWSIPKWEDQASNP